MENLFYNFLSFPGAIAGALTEAIKSVCSANCHEWMNVFQDGVLEQNGVICNLRWKNRREIGSQMFQNF